MATILARVIGNAVHIVSLRQSVMPVTPSDLAAMKSRGEPIVMLTAYDYSSAVIADRAEVPVLLVGDSLGMVMHGHDTTLPVTLDDMVRHAAAVVRGAKNALIVADLPFLTYADEAQAVRSAARLMQEAGVRCVKLEGGAEVAPIVRKLVSLGVPVMAHIGFTPQSVHQIGLKVQGKAAADARRMLDDALALQAAGAFALVIELAPADLAAAITRRLNIPTIGIGAGAGCDGQVQVWHDVLGLYGDKSPRHAKRFADLGAVIEDALRSYRDEVAAKSFPTAANSSKIDPDQLAQALEGR
jgi:3-methyl-2-oxobutanoate hydroxymethyltransferase